MKTTAPLRWFHEWDKEARQYAVRKGGFTDSLHPSKIQALERIVKLDEAENEGQDE
jgi:hypothetical protein